MLIFLVFAICIRISCRRFLKLFTELPLDRIAELSRLEGAGINEAKVILDRQLGRDAGALNTTLLVKVYLSVEI